MKKCLLINVLIMFLCSCSDDPDSPVYVVDDFPNYPKWEWGDFGAYKLNWDSISLSIISEVDIEIHDTDSNIWDGVVTLNGDTVTAKFYFRVDEHLHYSRFTVNGGDSLNILLSGSLDSGIYLNTQQLDTMFKGEYADTFLYVESKYYEHNFTAIFGSDTVRANVVAPKILISQNTETKIPFFDTYYSYHLELLLGANSRAQISKSYYSERGVAYQGECTWEKSDDTLSVFSEDKWNVDFIYNDSGDIYIKDEVLEIDYYKDLFEIEGECKFFMRQLLESYEPDPVYYI